MLDAAEERGYVESAELEAFVLEHDLVDDDVEVLARELVALGLEIGQPAAPEAATSTTSKIGRASCRERV